MDVIDCIDFLRGREQSCRTYAANVNPCADAEDKVKMLVLERADEFKACAEVMEAKRSQDWVPLAKALFEIERDPTIKDQAWFNFQGKAQRILAAMAAQQDNRPADEIVGGNSRP